MFAFGTSTCYTLFNDKKHSIKIKAKRKYRWNKKFLLAVTKHETMAFFFKDWHFCGINLLYQPS